MLAIIGGTGLTRLANLEVSGRHAVRTPYGEPSAQLTSGTIRGAPVTFLARHGDAHTIAPHEVNYRANLWALRERGAREIVSVASVGGIRRDLGPGAIVVPHQIIDYTWGRASTFFDSGAPVKHIDFTEPYDAGLRARLLAAARRSGETAGDRAVYAATQGPRLETAAEIDRLERDGADVVGMTGMPEAALARELELPYAAIAVVVNHAAGRGASAHGIQMREIEAVLEGAMSRVSKVIEALVTA
jgi:5'-methylthioinosine phosphorylase